MSESLHNLCLAEPCEIEIASPWSMDQYIWRLWTSLHFLPIKVMQQRNLRKSDLKKIASLLNENNSDQLKQIERLESLIFMMLKTELLAQQSGVIVTKAVNWKQWQQTLRTALLKTIRGWERWSESDEELALQLLKTLPTNCWLKLDEVVGWLQDQANDNLNLISANWMAIFTQHNALALHHLNMSRRSIFLLPEFQAVLNQTPVSFPAPGWYGALENASVSGFISPTGEIQLTPDCDHRLLHQLSPFCNITSVEQIITLQLDQTTLERMCTDKVALIKARQILESIQSPLPQALSYAFDKTANQQAIATVAATSLVMVINDAAAIHTLQKTGVEFSQPFTDRPEIVLLDASADAHTFIRACHQAGIILDTLVPPVQWITGNAALNAWMQVNLDREDHWLEIIYQKTLNSASKQTFARIDADFYGAIRIQPTRKTRQRYQLLKTTIELQAKHVLQLRELDDAEVDQLGLDLLVEKKA